MRPLLLGVTPVASIVLLSHHMQVLAALLAIIVLGVPHGALDGELARTILRPRLGRAWFPIFALPYLALSMLVLVAWHVAPIVTLAAFLAASVWHFGSEDAAGGSLADKLVSGGMPVAVPMLAHRADTVALFTTIIGRPLAGFASWWTVAALAWTLLAVVWTVRSMLTQQWRQVGELGLLLGGFLLLPPLTAFALYFIAVHAPNHMAALIADKRAARIRDVRSAWWLALPVTGLTVLLGVALWPLYGGPVVPRLLAVTIQGLAALTLPHMLQSAWFDRCSRSAPWTSRYLTIQKAVCH